MDEIRLLNYLKGELSEEEILQVEALLLQTIRKCLNSCIIQCLLESVRR